MSSYSKGRIENVLVKGFEALRYTPSKLRMRLQFGILLLREWKKNQPLYQPIELRDLLLSAGPRGTALFDTLLVSIPFQDMSLTGLKRPRR